MVLSSEQMRAILRAAGWSDQDIDDMDPEERAQAVEDALAQGVAAAHKDVAPSQTAEPQDPQRKGVMANVSTAAWTVVGLLLFGFAVKTGASMPSYAVVFLNDATQTYVPLPCLEAWQASGENDIIERALAVTPTG